MHAFDGTEFRSSHMMRLMQFGLCPQMFLRYMLRYLRIHFLWLFATDSILHTGSIQRVQAKLRKSFSKIFG